MIVNYNHNCSFIVLATVITIVNYGRKTFIVQATRSDKRSSLFSRRISWQRKAILRRRHLRRVKEGRPIFRLFVAGLNVLDEFGDGSLRRRRLLRRRLVPVGQERVLGFGKAVDVVRRGRAVGGVNDLAGSQPVDGSGVIGKGVALIAGRNLVPNWGNRFKRFFLFVTNALV